MAAKKLGRPTDSLKDKEIRVRANPETIRKLEECSKRLNTSKSDIVRRGIDKMYDDLFNDFEKVYAENKAIKAEKYAKYEAMTSKNSNNSAYTPRKSEFEADYYMDNQGFLVKNDVKEYDREDIDMSDRDGDYDLDI